ncbi:prenyltransferase [Daldinia decipiens]|uniref:prenyltransferase n=1 Tax=Daldinia decipiens TaxID=326647 RepID=UPI0020C278CB|nr:prenyltransferase [Daldinia decipiens]KAI1656395.1 prenyltransferase [Daldinia decipiens]
MDKKMENRCSMNDNKNESLSQQYGGVHSSGWVDLLPSSWVPYVQLARLSPPAALFLIYLPHFFGIIHAARMERHDLSDVLRSCILLLGGSLFYSNAAHAWNDLIDAPIDKRVARTKNRPIVRGDITMTAAFVFALSQALCAACFLSFLPRCTAISTIPSIIGATYYPWAKLHTHFPQLILGFCLSWGAVVGASTLGIEKPWTETPVICLIAALILWITIYDTIYAYQDITDDEKVGVKSTAVLFKESTKSMLWFLLILKGGFLVGYGGLTEAGVGYYVIAFGGSVLSLGAMIASVDLKDQASCWWWFSVGFWFTGGSLAFGLIFG